MNITKMVQVNGTERKNTIAWHHTNDMFYGSWSPSPAVLELNCVPTTEVRKQA